MISSQAFILAHLAIVLIALVVFAFVERRGLRSFTSNNRGVRYRHMTSAEVIRLIRRSIDEHGDAARILPCEAGEGDRRRRWRGLPPPDR